MPPETTLISVLSGTIATLAGVIAYLYRESAKAAMEREVRQQEKVEDVLRSFAATLTQMSVTIATLAESERKIADYITELAIHARSRSP